MKRPTIPKIRTPEESLSRTRLTAEDTIASTHVSPVPMTPEQYAAFMDECTRVYEASRPPLAMLLWCPECGERHVDAGDFATKPHHTHACQGCGMVWRPALANTVGVRFLPGFKGGAP